MVFPAGYALLTGLIGFVGYLYVNGRPKKIFVSYYSKGDSHYKNMIMAWAKNNNFKIDVEDQSTDTNIGSHDRNYLKRRMREQIGKADYFIVLIGQETYRREWVNWEIEQAKNLGKRIIAVKEKQSHKSPKPLLNCGATWVFGFSEEGIRKALLS
jgi:hypothetical protein